MSTIEQLEKEEEKTAMLAAAEDLLNWCQAACMADKRNTDKSKHISLQMINPHSIITPNPQTVEWLQKRLVTTIGPAPGRVSTVIPGMPPYPGAVSYAKGAK